VRRAAALAVAVVVFALAVGPAEASYRRRTDPRDADEPYDIRVTSLRSFEMRGGATGMVTKVRFFASDTPKSGVRLVWHLDTNGGPRTDRVVRLDSYANDPVTCEVYSTHSDASTKARTLKSRNRLACVFPRRLLRVRKPIRWRVAAWGPTLPDIAPNGGWFS